MPNKAKKKAVKPAKKKTARRDFSQIALAVVEKATGGKLVRKK
jgi:hypothetical protein